MSDDKLFIRLIYYGTVHLHRSEEESWLMPIGQLLDLWELHKQFLGIAKPKTVLFIDEIIPLETV